MRDRPEDVVEDEVADLVAERLSGILVIAEVLARVDTARCRLVGRLREALEAPQPSCQEGGVFAVASSAEVVGGTGEPGRGFSEG